MGWVDVARCTRKWPDRTVGPYLLSVVFAAETDRRIEVRSATVSGVGDRAVPTRTLRRVPWGRVVADMLDELRDRWAPLVERYQPEVAARLRTSPAPRGRPPLYDDAHWSDVSAVYRSAANRPVVAVAERWQVSRAAARHWVERCRAKGML